MTLGMNGMDSLKCCKKLEDLTEKISKIYENTDTGKKVWRENTANWSKLRHGMISRHWWNPKKECIWSYHRNVFLSSPRIQDIGSIEVERNPTTQHGFLGGKKCSRCHNTSYVFIYLYRLIHRASRNYLRCGTEYKCNQVLWS